MQCWSMVLFEKKTMIWCHSAELMQTILNGSKGLDTMYWNGVMSAAVKVFEP